MSGLFPVSGKNNRVGPQTGSSMVDLFLLQILQGQSVGWREEQRGSDFRFVVRNVATLRILILPAKIHTEQYMCFWLTCF